MPRVSVECSNPDAMILRVSTEMTVGEWNEVLVTVSGTKYYGPLDDLKEAISQGIKAIRSREEVTYPKNKKGGAA